MMTLKEFGQTPASVTDSVPTIVAAWLVDFSDFGDTIELDLSALAAADTFTIADPTVGLYAGPSPSSIAGATLLATVAFGASVSYVGAKTSVTITNPGGRQYVLATGTQGSG